MFRNIRSQIRKPLTILMFSFLVGVAMDALAESLSAQEPASKTTSSRKTNQAYRLIRLAPKQEFSGDDVQEDDSLSSMNDKEDEPEDDEPEADERPTDLLQVLDGSELKKPIMDIQLNVLESSARAPEDQSDGLLEMSYVSNYPGTFQHRIASWTAPNIRYQPLDFEDVAAERYGYHFGNCLQPAASAIHFAKSFALFVPNMFHDPPHACTYPLGFCRPGSPAPQTTNRWLR